MSKHFHKDCSDTFMCVIDPAPKMHDLLGPDADWYLPVLGPSSLVVTQMLLRYSEIDDVTSWSLRDLCARTGLGADPLRRTLDRMMMFGVMSEQAGIFWVHRYMRPLTASQLNRMPVAYAQTYVEQFLTNPTT